ncbi:hypothetical protein AB0P37_48470, partial [Streptomyces antimycoticus]
ELREALDLLPETPIVTCDARDEKSSAKALMAQNLHASAAARARAPLSRLARRGGLRARPGAEPSTSGAPCRSTGLRGVMPLP